MDYSDALNKIAGTLEKLGEPLTEAQKLGMAGSLAVWMEKARIDGIRHAESMYRHCQQNGINWP